MASVRVGIGAFVGVGNIDAAVLATSAADVTPNVDPFTSNTVSVTAQWPGAALTVVWNNTNIKVGTVVQITSLTSRIRSGVTASVAGSVTIERSSGSVADEKFHATLAGTP